MINTSKRLNKETLKSLSLNPLLIKCVVTQLLFRSKFTMVLQWKILFKNHWMNLSLMTEMLDLFRKKNLPRPLSDCHSHRTMKTNNLPYTASMQRLVIKEWSQVKSINNGRTLCDLAQEISIIVLISMAHIIEVAVRTLQRTENEWSQGLLHSLAFMTLVLISQMKC